MAMGNEINIDNRIFDFCYGMAMNDATMQRAYGGSKGSKDSLLEIEDLRNEAKSYMNKVIEGNGQEDLYETAKKIVEIAKDADKVPKKLTFGNAQKLVNMTAKYMFISAYSNPDRRKKFKNCHCPMDSIMKDKVSKVIRRLKEKEFKDLNTELAGIAGSPGISLRWGDDEGKRLNTLHVKEGSKRSVAFAGWFDEVPWSRMEMDPHVDSRYIFFQAAVSFLCKELEPKVGRGLIPLEFDYCIFDKSEKETLGLFSKPFKQTV